MEFRFRAKSGNKTFDEPSYMSLNCTVPHNSGHALGSDFCHLGSCVFAHQVEMSRMDRQPADRESQTIPFPSSEL